VSEAEARARIEEDTQYLKAPALTAAEVTRLVLRARVADAAGLDPDGSGYVATWDAAGVRRAVGLGWFWKAGKVAGEYEVALGGGKNFKRNQAWEMCMRNARAFGYGLGEAHSVALTLGGR
jgi:hypothetical protein